MFHQHIVSDKTPDPVPVLTVDDIYQGQITQLVDLIGRVMNAACPLDFDVQSIARLMHNLAGTASYFGDEPIGRQAAALEIPLRSANDPATIKRLCADMLEALR